MKISILKFLSKGALLKSSFVQSAASPSTLDGDSYSLIDSPPASSFAGFGLEASLVASSSFGAPSFLFDDCCPPPPAYSPSFLNGIFLEARKFFVIISLISSSVSSES
jgi:hypothetical protein